MQRSVLWANPTGAAMFGAPTPAALAVRTFDRTHTAAAEVARVAATLRDDGAVRLERLRGFGAAMGRMLTCACSRITLADGTSAVLIAAAEASGPRFAAARTRDAAARRQCRAGRGVRRRRRADRRDGGGAPHDR